MRKLNSTSKRKWILSGALAFGAVALLTTGFATWIVGVNRTNQNNETEVTVDTVNNQSAILNMGTMTDKTIKLAETEKVDEGLVTNPSPDGDLAITFTGVTFRYGDAFLTGKQVKGIRFSLPTEKVDSLPDVDFTTNKKMNNPVTANNKIGDKRTASPDTGWTYVTAPIDFTTKGTTSKENGLNVVTWDTVTVNFTWGTFFENKSPANFYNSKFTKSEAKPVDMENITTELTEMDKAFKDNGGKLKLLAEIIVE